MFRVWIISCLSLVVVGCSTVYSPSIAVYKAKEVSFAQYEADVAECRTYASQQLDATAPTVPPAVKAAGIAGAVGAATGAAIGAARGAPGQGAAIGAAGGVATGAAGGVLSQSVQHQTTQRQYDLAFGGCMQARGHMVPGAPRER